MLAEIRQYFMEPRPRWNRMGPRLPCWFRQKLVRVDPKLRLQFMVPHYVHPDGVDANQYPNGIWIITRALRRTGWLFLHARWTWSLAMPQMCGDGVVRDFHRTPTRDDIHVLELARDLHRRGKEELLQEEFDKTCRGIMKERADWSKQRMVGRLKYLMDRNGMTNYGRRRVVVAGTPWR